MAVDIVPQLKDNIFSNFDTNVTDNKRITELLVKLENKTATYKDAHEYSLLIGDMLTDALGQNVTSEILPDGKMYFNIADRILNPLLTDGYNRIADYAVSVQNIANEASGITTKAIRSQLNVDRIEGIINRISSEQFEDIAWILGDPVLNFSEAIVDDTIKDNCEWQSKAGLKPVINRLAEVKCCEWCSKLEGMYNYPDDVPKDVYRRHENCRCFTEYRGNGKVENVWGKAKAKRPIKATADLRNSTRNLAQELSTEDYNKLINEINNGEPSVRKLYVKYGDTITFARDPEMGKFSREENKIIYRIDQDAVSKFETIYHEYGHLFDSKSELFANLTFKEFGQLAKTVSSESIYITVSKSDQYLNAVRKDIDKLTLLIKDDAFMDDLYDNLIYSKPAHDIINGYFDIQTLFTHKENYFFGNYLELIDRDKKEEITMLQSYKQMGYDIYSFNDVKKLMSHQIIAEELFAHTTQQLTTNNKTSLAYMKKVFPNTLEITKEILAKL